MQDYLNLSGLVGTFTGGITGAVSGYAATQGLTDSNLINSLGILIGGVAGALSGAEIGQRISGAEGVLSKIKKGFGSSIENRVEKGRVTREQQVEYEEFFPEKSFFFGLEETIGSEGYTSFLSEKKYTLPTQYGEFILKMEDGKIILKSSKDFKDGYEGNSLTSIHYSQARIVAFSLGLNFTGKAYNPQLSASWYQDPEKIKLLEKTRKERGNVVNKSFDLSDILNPKEERPPAKFQVELKLFDENSLAKAVYKIALAEMKLKEILNDNWQEGIICDKELEEVSSGTFLLN